MDFNKAKTPGRKNNEKKV